MATCEGENIFRGWWRRRDSNSRPPRCERAAKSAAERLRELKALADEGLITSEEYAAQRKAIIGAI